MKVGSEIEAACDACKNTTHTVTSVTHGTTASVMCNSCGATRRYLASVDAAEPKKIVAGAAKQTTKRAKKAETLWSPDKSHVDAVMSRPVRPYRLSDSYRLGDRVEHATFGVGIVDEILGPNKVQIFFQTGHRKMAQGAPVA